MSYGNNFNNSIISSRNRCDPCEHGEREERCDNSCNPNCLLNNIQRSQVQQLINNALANAFISLPPGPPGPTGPTGPVGPAGPAGTGAGAPISFSSGLIPLALTSLNLLTAGTQVQIGFGTTVPQVSIFGAPVDLTATILNEAFNLARAGTLTSIAGTFVNAVLLGVPAGSVDIVVQLYSAPATSNIFSPIPGASLTLTPSFSGIGILPGTIASGITGPLAIPIAANTRLLLVVSAVAVGAAPLLLAITGSFSGGINIL